MLSYLASRPRGEKSLADGRGPKLARHIFNFLNNYIWNALEMRFIHWRKFIVQTLRLGGKKKLIYHLENSKLTLS